MTEHKQKSNQNQVDLRKVDPSQVHDLLNQLDSTELLGTHEKKLGPMPPNVDEGGLEQRMRAVKAYDLLKERTEERSR